WILHGHATARVHGVAHGQGNGQRADAVLAGRGRLAVAPYGRVEQAHGVHVQVFGHADVDLLVTGGVLAPQHHAPDRILGHHVLGVERALRAVDLEPGVRVADGEGVVVLG